MELVNIIDNDCLSHIFSFVSNSYTYNSICLSSSFFYKLAKKVHPNAEISLAFLLLIIYLYC